MNPSEKWVPLGKVLREWGVRGQVKCVCFNPDSDLMGEAKALYLQTPEGYRLFSVERVEPHDEYWRIKFTGIETPEAARHYRGRLIALPREQLPELAQGETYLEDLLGFQVLGPDGTLLGKILAWETVGSSEVFLVGEKINSSYRVPYREEFVKETLKAEDKIILTPLGLELFKL